MDLRLVEEGNRTMKIVGKESVVAAVFAGRSKRVMCFASRPWKYLAMLVVNIRPFVGSLGWRISR
jgi:hypothetical protein